MIALVISAAPGGASAVSAGIRSSQGGVERTGSIEAIAKNAHGRNLAHVRVQVRALNGSVAATGMTDAAGRFSAAGLNPATYTVEILDAAGNILGTASVSVAAGASAAVTVSASAAGAIAAASGGGVSLLGLGTAGSLAVLGAAGAVAIGAVGATRNTASPSR